MIYLDNAATTRPYPEVTEVIAQMNNEFYANPSSMHTLGFKAEKKLRESKESLLRIISAKSGDVIFTSGGTESNNQILFGTLFSSLKRGVHIIVSAVEHPSVSEPAKALEALGCEVTFVSPDENGIISAKSVVPAIRDNTRLVSVMAVNNETGAINPIADIAKKVKEKNKEIIVHTDCVQAMGNIKISVDKWGVDAASFSAHKICGPKGVGALYIRDKVRVLPVILGGHQQKNLRSGTENLPGIAGFVKAAEITDELFLKKSEHLFTLKDKIIKTLNANGGFIINNEGSMYSSHIVSIRVKNVRAEVLLHALEAHGICVSAGSACSTNKPAPSHVLLAQGLDRRHIEETIRVSLGTYNTKDEIDEFLDILIKEASQLSKFVRV